MLVAFVHFILALLRLTLNIAGAFFWVVILIAVATLLMSR